MMIFPVGTSGETIELTDAVISHLLKHRQTRWWYREAGGLLFARITGKTIRLEEATGPRKSDVRTPYSYWPNRKAEQTEIEDHFKRGLHYVGDWHSHPENFPEPSGRDVRTMTSRVRRSEHQLNGILFAIIGQAPLPDGLTVVVHDGVQWHQLQAIAEPSLEPAPAIDAANVQQSGGVEA